MDRETGTDEYTDIWHLKNNKSQVLESQQSPKDSQPATYFFDKGRKMCNNRNVVRALKKKKITHELFFTSLAHILSIDLSQNRAHMWSLGGTIIEVNVWAAFSIYLKLQ